MMDMIWKRIDKKRPKGKKLFKMVGIVSGLIWIAALGSIFAFKDKKLPEAVLEAAGTKADTLDIHGVKAETVESAHEAVESAHETIGMPSRDEIEALRQVAELNVRSGDLEEALAPIQRVMVVPTRDLELLALATTIFLGTAHYPQALQTAEQALALSPDDIPVKIQAIEATFRLGKVEEAMAEAHAAVKEHPDDIPLLVQLGSMEVELGANLPDYGKALAAALALSPTNPDALYLLGRKAQLEGNFQDAVNAFKTLLLAYPKKLRVHGQLGMALYHLGKPDEAHWEFQIELALNPKDYNTWFNEGEFYLGKANLESFPDEIQAMRTLAMEAYLKTLEFNPNHAQAHYRVGVLLNGNGQYKEAIRQLEAAYELDSKHVPTLVQLSLAYERLKLPERAKAYLTKAYELDPLNKLVLSKLKPWS